MRAKPWCVAISLLTALCAAAMAGCSSQGYSRDTSASTVKVGLLNSTTGTLSFSEKPVRNALLLAVDQINAAGGVLGKQIQPVTADGASDPATFVAQAEQLINSDQVEAIFGCWTSASRKAVLPVLEKHNSLLFYPVQYEGLESSPQVFYIGATTNQQIIPALDYLKTRAKKELFLVGSDYVFPRSANNQIKAYATANGIKIVGERYAPLGSTDFGSIVSHIKTSGADAVFNTINGNSNIAFFEKYKASGLTAAKVPIMSVSIAEPEVKTIGASNTAGQLVAWNYFQTTPGIKNTEFVNAYHAKYGSDQPTADPMQAAYISLFLWKAMVEKAGSFDPDRLKASAHGIKMDAPEGPVTVVGFNQHLIKTARIGQIQADGTIVELWRSNRPIEPDPYLNNYAWAKDLI